ncbi:hypothetical protein UUU_45290 [Klebsiella pneumoniae subsp. pneumoniae DSM 30104 = JCM 1662 = NBRC 14940]|nr:hypothetical protein UUU_45290 [Klebsiella pneumoniae subsp. pneumoniae DSM 30104 = JCM 1662 = NBRC 14940]
MFSVSVIKASFGALFFYIYSVCRNINKKYNIYLIFTLY